MRNFASILIDEFKHLGVKIVTDSINHFDTVTIDSKASGFSSADYVVSEFHKYGINLRRVDDNLVSISFNETSNLVDLDEIIEIFAELKQKPATKSLLTDKFYEHRKYSELPKELKRTSTFLQQAQFTEITSET